MFRKFGQIEECLNRQLVNRISELSIWPFDDLPSQLNMVRYEVRFLWLDRDDNCGCFASGCPW